MDKIIDLIITDGDDKLEHLQSELCKCQDMLAKNREKSFQFEEALPMIDPARNTLGMIHILHIISTQTKFDKSLFIASAIQLIIRGSIKQIRVDPKRFAIVCRKLVEVCRETAQPMRAIKPMMVAINKVGLENHLTPQHALLFLACISSKCYTAALPFLNSFVYIVDEKTTGIKAEDTRLYYYYGGVCYLALKKWKKAIQFFETVISYPAILASAIMVEGYKKYVLASLIYKGAVKDVPKYTNSAAMRNYKQYCVPYDELTNAFETRSLDVLVATIERHLLAFDKDKHLGLVGQVKSALIQQSILRLPDVFTTITFAGLKEHAGNETLRETESRLVKLVESNDLKLKIDQKNQYISFNYDGETYADDETVNYLRDHIHNTITIHRHLALVDRKIEKDEKYVQRILKHEGGSDRMMDVGASMQGRNDYIMDVDDYEGFTNVPSEGHFM